MKIEIIRNLSNDIIRDRYKEGLSERQILKKIKKMKPKNPIEKRAIQRIACLVGGFIKIQEGKFKNHKLEYLLNCLKK